MSLATTSDSINNKIPLPRFLQLLTSNSVPASKAMFIAGKIYKEFNTTSKLHAITDVKLHALGVNAKEDRKLALSAFRKAGFYPKRKVSKETSVEASTSSTALQDHPQAPLLLPKLKRKRETDLNEYLPNGPAEESFSTSDFRFQEELDPQVLNSKFAVINRAPIMTAWVMTVAEHLGFKREEALSIASVYTEMNAIEKGVSIGLLNERATGSRVNTSKTGNQPWVEVLGRRIPLYQTQDSQWRALSDGVPISPAKAFTYIMHSFRQTTPYILGSMRLLAKSYSPAELNAVGWGLYADFRPSVDGKRSEVRCSTILALRKDISTNSDRKRFEPSCAIQPSVPDVAEDTSVQKSI